MLLAVVNINFMLKWRWVLEPFSSYHCLTSGLNKDRRIQKMELLLPHTFAFSCLLRGFWETLSVLLIIKVLKEEGWVLKLAFNICGESIRLLLKYCIYCASAPSLHRESTNSLMSFAGLMMCSMPFIALTERMTYAKIQIVHINKCYALKRI